MRPVLVVAFIWSTLARKRSTKDRDNTLMGSKSSPEVVLVEVAVEVEKVVETAAEAAVEGEALRARSRRFLAHDPWYHGATKSRMGGTRLRWSRGGTGVVPPGVVPPVCAGQRPVLPPTRLQWGVGGVFR